MGFFKNLFATMASTNLGKVSGGGFNNATLLGGSKQGVPALLVVPSKGDTYAFTHADVKNAVSNGLNMYRVDLNDGKTLIITYDVKYVGQINSVLF